MAGALPAMAMAATATPATPAMTAMTATPAMTARELARALSESLQSMKDVPGVQGSFVVSDLGRLLARDMPAAFGDEVLGEVGPRTLRLRDTLGDGAEVLSWCVVRYGTNLLCLRPLRDGLLIALTDKDANLPAVRMAMSHASRRLNPLLDNPMLAAGDEPTVSRTQELPVAVVERQPAGGTPPPPAPVLFYRGAVVKNARR